MIPSAYVVCISWPELVLCSIVVVDDLYRLVYTYVYIYIYIYTHRYVYIYIYLVGRENYPDVVLSFSQITPSILEN